jgi:hypothetical protein
LSNEYGISVFHEQNLQMGEAANDVKVPNAMELYTQMVKWEILLCIFTTKKKSSESILHFKIIESKLKALRVIEAVRLIKEHCIYRKNTKATLH